MSVDIPFTKENLDFYLKELAKEYRRRGRGVHAELILIGGASVLVNYGFREMTYDLAGWSQLNRHKSEGMPFYWEL